MPFLMLCMASRTHCNQRSPYYHSSSQNVLDVSVIVRVSTALSRVVSVSQVVLQRHWGLVIQEKMYAMPNGELCLLKRDG
jgi:hypothetical protein